jgi:hypothetical protein
MDLKDTLPEEAGRYAGLLEWGTRRLGLLVLSFIAHVGSAAPHVPLEQLPQL